MTNVIVTEHLTKSYGIHRGTCGALVLGSETKYQVAIHRRVGYLPGEWGLCDRLTGDHGPRA